MPDTAGSARLGRAIPQTGRSDHVLPDVGCTSQPPGHSPASVSRSRIVWRSDPRFLLTRTFCSLAVSGLEFTIGATIRGGEEQRLQNLLAKVPIGAGMRKRPVTALVCSAGEPASPTC